MSSVTLYNEGRQAAIRESALAEARDGDGACGWMEAVEGFVHYLSTGRVVSKNTVAAYRSDLKQLGGYIFGRAPRRVSAQWDAVDTSKVEDFLLDLRRRGYARASARRKVSAIRGFFAYLVKEGVVQHNPALDIASPRGRPAAGSSVSLDEVRALLMQLGARRTPSALRDAAMLQLLRSTGMRVSELVSLDVTDVRLDEMQVVIQRGRGGRERVLSIDREAADSLRAYVDEARPMLLRGRENPSLFLNVRGDRISRQGVWLLFKSYARAAGLGEGVTPRTLRHSFAGRA